MLSLRKRRRSMKPLPKVHLTFRSHPRDEPYMRSPRSDAKGVVYENAHGRAGFGKKGPFEGREVSDEIHERSRSDYLVAAGKRGSRVVAGESAGHFPLSAFRLWRLRRLRARMLSSVTLMRRAPSVDNIRSHFSVYAKYEKYRHHLIVGTIRTLIRKGETPVEARYGTIHSLLSPMIKREGVELERDVSPQVFGWYETIIRRLVHVKPTPSISRLDYKKGFISELFLEKMFDHLPASVAQTDETVRDVARIERRLLNRLSEEDVDLCIASYVNKGNWFKELCLRNGFSSVPSYSELLSAAQKKK